MMRQLGLQLAHAGWTGRSGGAEGADTAFYRGFLQLGRDDGFELYLPWANFNSIADGRHVALSGPSIRAYEIAARYHPAWQHLKRGARALHARNVHQVLGKNLDHPATMIVCWTPDGSCTGNGPDTGGTGMALRIAHGMSPSTQVFNLARTEHRERIGRYLS